MRRFLFILLAVLTFYLAGVYRYLPLMVLSVMEVVYFVASFFLSLYFRKNLSIEALRHSDCVEKGGQLACGVRVINRGKLPVSRFGVRLRYRYGSNGKGIFRRKTKIIYGSCDRGESILHFEISGCCCGRMYLKMDDLYAYDYLSLFSVRRKVNEEIEVAVFPKERGLHIELPSFSYRENNRSQGLVAGQGVDAHSEIRQLREYRREDSNRYIHWNQSARTGLLVVKEYEKEQDFATELLLGVAGLGEARESETDAFYELVSALVLGLLKRAAAVRVHWYDGHRKCLADTGVVSEGQCRDMLLKLYRIDGQEAADAQEKAELERRFMAQGSAFRLGADLCWYWNETLIFRFSKEKIEEQIAWGNYVI